MNNPLTPSTCILKVAHCLAAMSLVIVTSTHVFATETIEHPEKGMQYETLVFRFATNLHFENPFDLETNRIELRIQRPDSSTSILSFFYDGQDKTGTEQWVARYAPTQAGLYHFSVFISGVEKSQFQLPVERNERAKQGGLRISDRPGVFNYESGEAFRGIGINVCWAQNYEYYFRKMKAVGMNVTRIWMCPWNLTFEWTESGLGRYNLESARKLDEILLLAKKYGIYVILCIDFHGIAPKGLGFFKEDRWQSNPYNKANGGPCMDRADFFTNEEAKIYSKRKYKYIVSRFGHSSQILAWEFINEADLMAGKSIPINRWHVEMAEYVKSVDIHHRLVSSSSTRQYMEKLVDAFRSPATDFVMFHDYNSLNIATHFTYLFEACIEYYQKPVVIGEFGVEFRGADLTYKIDPQHIGLHNGIWAGWFNETPVIPLSWWWDNYIDPHNLWSEYANLSRFADSMDFSATHLAFKTLTAGMLSAHPQDQAPCLVRAVYSGTSCALWIKNLDYQWSSAKDGKDLKEVTSFIQKIPDLVIGRYAVSWYDPQTGQFIAEPAVLEESEESELLLSVPAFLKDLACIVTRLH